MTSINNYNALLSETLNLRGSQCRVIANLEGQLLVIAPPKSGRKLVMAMRIRQVISETKCYPFQIIIITSKRARIQLIEEMLNDVIYPSDTLHIPILTFEDIYKGLLFRSTSERIDPGIIEEAIPWEVLVEGFKQVVVDISGGLQPLHAMLLIRILELFKNVTIFSDTKNIPVGRNIYRVSIER